jgi:hypothetical protein
LLFNQHRCVTHLYGIPLISFIKFYEPLIYHLKKYR